MVTFYPTQIQARADAVLHTLREKVLCLVVRGEALLIFEHVDIPEAGVQVPAGGVEVDETPSQAAVRELCEESGLTLASPCHLVSYRWEAQLPERLTRQVCHSYVFVAPATTPDAWTHHADGYAFASCWAPLAAPALPWEMDAALPWLQFDPTHSTPFTSPQENRA